MQNEGDDTPKYLEVIDSFGVRRGVVWHEEPKHGEYQILQTAGQPVDVAPRREVCNDTRKHAVDDESVLSFMSRRMAAIHVLRQVDLKDISDSAEDSTTEVVRGLKTRTELQAAQGAIRIQQLKEQWLDDGLGLTLQQAAALYCTQSWPCPLYSNIGTY